jgi:hypothetical protein
MSMNFKKNWAWFCGLAGPVLAVYAPYIGQLDLTHIPKETHGSAVLVILTGIGLLNMKRPGDHQSDFDTTNLNPPLIPPDRPSSQPDGGK